MERIDQHTFVAAALDALSDEEVAAWLGASEPLRRDGNALLALPGGDQVFVKLLALTDLEQEPPHWPSTANCFGLPPYYGYRIGGAGFGVRRELEAHAMANEWVLAGECASFVLMHGYRVVPIARPVFHAPVWPNPWGDHPAVAARHAAVEGSSRCVAVFLESFERNLLHRLRDRSETLDVRELEAKLLALAAFINERGLHHMDLHFGNLVTDGNAMHLTDFGLAIADRFELGDAERAFFERHRCFDRATAMTSLVHAVFTRHAGEPRWRDALRTFLDGSSAVGMPPVDRDFLVRRGPLWLAMTRFYKSLEDDITADFPAEEIERLLRQGAPHR
ncbi:MAG: hypothetical protein AAGE52_10600 [Myxococcota bacterium]